MKKIFSVFALMIVGGGAYVNNVFAADVDFSVNVEESISVSLPTAANAPKINFSSVSGAGSFGKASFSVGVSLNVPRRYLLSMYSASGATDATSLKSSTSTLPTLTTTETANATSGAGWSSSAYNHWGYAVGGGDSLIFSGVGGSSSASVLHGMNASAASTVNNAVTTVTLGTVLNMGQAAGDYTTTLNFVVLAELVYTYNLAFDANNGSGAPSTMSSGNQSTSSYSFTIPATEPTSADSGLGFLGWSTNPLATTADYEPGDSFQVTATGYNTLSRLYAVYGSTSLCGSTMAMQSITSSYISSMTTNAQVQMCDERDGKFYWVSKLADGNVWMTQNLDFDLSTSTALTFADSDVASSWTPTLSTHTSAEAWSGADEQSESYDPGNNYIPSGTGSATSAASLASNSINLHYHQGNYYNWYATTAGSIASAMSNGNEAPQSICPKGWRLPYGTQANKSWYYLVNQASITVSNVNTSPFYVSRAGYSSNGAVRNIGYFGHYWSSTASGYSSAYYLESSPVIVDPQVFLTPDYGLSVRCVSR